MKNRTLTGLPSVAEQNGLPCQSRAKRIAERTLFRISLPTSAEQLQDLFRLQNRTITKLISIAKQNLAKFISVV